MTFVHACNDTGCPSVAIDTFAVHFAYRYNNISFYIFISYTIVIVYYSVWLTSTFVFRIVLHMLKFCLLSYQIFYLNILYYKIGT